MRELEAMARAGELTAGIVHEVRNGLGTIVGYARLHRARPGPAGRARGARHPRRVRHARDGGAALHRLRQARAAAARRDRPRAARRAGAGARAAGSRRGRRPARRVRRAARGARPTRSCSSARSRTSCATPSRPRRPGAGTSSCVRRAPRAACCIDVEDDGPGFAADHPGEVRPFYTTRPGGLGPGTAARTQDRAPARRGAHARAADAFGSSRDGSNARTGRRETDRAVTEGNPQRSERAGRRRG